MQYFKRSLKYLWPYRMRIGVAVLCVFLIAALWGGGLGMMLPGAKILLAPEGLHGWAWRSLVEDKLSIKIVRREAPPGLQVDGQELSIVLDVVSTEKGAPADLHRNRWIVGLLENGQQKIVRGDVLLRDLALTEKGDARDLVVYDNHNKTTAVVHAMFGEAGVWNGSQALGYVATHLREPKSDKEKFPLFIYLLVAATVITLFRAFFTFVQEYLIGTAIWQATMDMRCENYNVVLHLPTTFFSEKGVSDATSRFIQDTNELARGQNTLFGKTLVEPAKAIASVAVALAFSWEMTLVALLAGPPAFLIIRQLGKKMHKASRKALENWSTMLEVLGETLQGIRVVKAYTMEGAERKRFFQVNRQLLKQQNKMERLDAASSPAIEAAGIVVAMVAAGFAGYVVFVGIPLSSSESYTMDSSKFLTWMGALFAMFDPVRKLAKVSLRFQASDAAAQRIFQLQDTPQEKAVRNAPNLPRHSKSIEFRNVSYRYPGASTDAVKNMSITIRAGQTAAIVGPNGSGKTTLISLVPRLLDPTDGSILIDGMDISQVSVRSLRRQIGLVTQDSVLFHATVAENISYGLRRPKQEDVLEVAKKAFVDEFIRDLPNGYDTMVGEHGATLSGGQKQRISIARALLRDPSILIFDEAMSQVDADSERRIHQTMIEFSKGRTTLMIAHRFATVLSADIILVMADGGLIDSGTHQELLGRCEIYRHLYQTQFADSGGQS